MGEFFHDAHLYTQNFSTMHICILRIEVTLPFRPSLLLYLGLSKPVLFKKPRFDKLFLDKMHWPMHQSAPRIFGKEQKPKKSSRSLQKPSAVTEEGTPN